MDHVDERVWRWIGFVVMAMAVPRVSVGLRFDVAAKGRVCLYEPVHSEQNVMGAVTVIPDGLEIELTVTDVVTKEIRYKEISGSDRFSYRSETEGLQEFCFSAEKLRGGQRKVRAGSVDFFLFFRILIRVF